MKAGRNPKRTIFSVFPSRAYTDCRISEALELTTGRVDLLDKFITFHTLKQRDKVKYRSVPCPDAVIDALELVHRVRKAQKAKRQANGLALWPWGRTQATKHICAVMASASIKGDHATPKGLRHGFGVRIAQKTRNPRLLQKLLGHTKLENTAIYMDLVGEEARAEVIGLGDCRGDISRFVTNYEYHDSIDDAHLVIEKCHTH